MTLLLSEERAALIEHARRLGPDGLAVGTSGNLSVRVGEVVAITPSGMDYDALTPGSMCLVDLDGRPVPDGDDGVGPPVPPAPSSELPMHLAVYRATDAGAVVHTHPLHATAISAVLDELPPVHYLTAALGGPVRVAPYATYGSAELAAGSVVALAGRSAVLLRNHGATTHGPTLAEAYRRSVLLEWLCALHCTARALGEPRLIEAAELDRVAARLASYGQPPR